MMKKGFIRIIVQEVTFLSSGFQARATQAAYKSCRNHRGVPDPGKFQEENFSGYNKDN